MSCAEYDAYLASPRHYISLAERQRAEAACVDRAQQRTERIMLERRRQDKNERDQDDARRRRQQEEEEERRQRVAQYEAERARRAETIERRRLEEARSEAVVQGTTKGCPGCWTRIEKSDGCMHMTCAVCRCEFCWECLGPWRESGCGNCFGSGVVQFF